jgi:hypothetical protein
MVFPFLLLLKTEQAALPPKTGAPFQYRKRIPLTIGQDFFRRGTAKLGESGRDNRGGSLPILEIHRQNTRRGAEGKILPPHRIC